MHIIETEKEENRIKSYLGRKLSEGKLILFTGSGFSLGAKNQAGKTLPNARDLAREISEIIGMRYSNTDSLKEVYQVAIRKEKKKSVHI